MNILRVGTREQGTQLTKKLAQAYHRNTPESTESLLTLKFLMTAFLKYFEALHDEYNFLKRYRSTPDFFVSCVQGSP